MQNPNLFFSTPVWVSEIDNYKETNEEIYNYIKELNRIDQSGIKKSNVLGWHSNVFNMNDKEPKNFIKLISPYINQMLIDMDWD